MTNSKFNALFFDAKTDSNTTLIFLHGGESNPETLQPITPFFHHVKLVLPQATYQISDHSYSWFHFINGSLDIDWKSLEESKESTYSFIQSIKNNNPKNNIYIGGISQSAVFANELFLSKPTDFAGLISFSGFLPDSKNAVNLSDKPILVSHGEKDPLISMNLIEKNVRQLQDLGATVDFLTYDMGHEIGEKELKDAAEWIKTESPV